MRVAVRHRPWNLAGALSAILLATGLAAAPPARAQAPEADTPARLHRLLAEGETDEAGALKAVAALGREPVVAFITELVGSRPGDADRVAALRMLGEVAVSSDCPLLLSLAGDGPPSGAVATVFRDTVVRLISRDLHGACRELSSAVARAHPRLLQAVLEAAESVDETGTLEIVLRILRRSRGYEGLLLPVVERLTPSRDLELNDALVGCVRAYLDDMEPMIRQMAAAALGTLGDHEMVPQLIDLLQDASPGVRENAARALRTITGLHLRTDAACWHDWLVEEQRWTACDSEACFAALDSPRPEVVAEALRTLVTHRLFRDRLAGEVCRVLEQGDPGRSVLACQALAQMGSRQAMRPLTEALASESQEVRAAAQAALTALGGIDLGPAPEAWRRHFRLPSGPCDR